MRRWLARLAVLCAVGSLALMPMSGAGFSDSTTADFDLATGSFAPEAGKQLFGAGVNTDGELGNGVAGALNYYTEVSGGLSTWTRVDFGSNHACALKEDRTVWCWGAGGNGQLGQGASGPSLVPVQVGSATDWSVIETGKTSSCALNTGKQLWCWGSNTDGTTAQGTTTGSTLSATQVGTDSNWSKLSVGGEVACATKTTGTLWCWGKQDQGQAGQTPVSATILTAPTQVGTDTNWASVAAGAQSVCALKTTGTLWCWGRNNNRQAAPTSATTPILTPTQVGAATTWSQVNVNQGNNLGGHACAINTTGELYCWGLNANGQIGQGNTTTPVTAVTLIGGASPSPAWTQISLGVTHTVALKADGTVWTWGSNGNGQASLGHNTASITSPTVTYSPLIGSTASWVAAGEYTTAATWAPVAGSQAYGAGKNGNNQIGDGTATTPRTSYVEVSGSSTRWYKVYRGANHSCALRVDRTIWCWGPNGLGQLGRTGASSSVPVQAGGGNTWVSLDAGDFHTCAINVVGELWCWGSHAQGQTGQSTSTGSVDVPTKVGTATDWATVSTGGYFTCATTTSNWMYCWGSQATAQTGQGSTSGTVRTTPLRVGTGTDWAKVFAGETTACAIKTNGDLYCWGKNSDRTAVPTSATTPITSPTLVDSTSDWVTVGIGTGNSVAGHACAINTAGELYCWGLNTSGQVGRGNTTSPATALTLIGSAAPTPAWTEVKGGTAYTVATKADGSVWAWGANASGQLGRGNTTTPQTSPTAITLLGTTTAATSVAANDETSLATFTPPDPVEYAGVASVSANGTSTVTIPVPAGTSAGDVLVAQVTTNGVTVNSVPAGWGTAVFSLTTVSFPKQFVYLKVATGSEPASYDWGLTSNNSVSGSMQRFTGVDTTTPQDVTGVSNYSTTTTTSAAPGTLTTVSPGAMLVGGASANGATLTFSPPSAPGTWTEDFENADGVGRSSTVAHYSMATAGSSGAPAFAISASRTWNAWMLALRPAP